MPKELVKHFFWVCLGGCFLRRFELVDWVKKIIFTNTDGHYLICRDWDRTKSYKMSKFTLCLSCNILRLLPLESSIPGSQVQTLLRPGPIPSVPLVFGSSDSYWDLPHWLPWFSDLWVWTRTAPLTLLGLQFAASRS